MKQNRLNYEKFKEENTKKSNGSAKNDDEKQIVK